MVKGILEVAGVSGEMDLDAIDERWQQRVQELLGCLTPADVVDIMENSPSDEARFKRIARWSEQPIRKLTFDELFKDIFAEQAT